MKFAFYLTVIALALAARGSQANSEGRRLASPAEMECTKRILEECGTVWRCVKECCDGSTSCSNSEKKFTGDGFRIARVNTTVNNWSNQCPVQRPGSTSCAYNLALPPDDRTYFTKTNDYPGVEFIKLSGLAVAGQCYLERGPAAELVLRVRGDQFPFFSVAQTNPKDCCNRPAGKSCSYGDAARSDQCPEPRRRLQQYVTYDDVEDGDYIGDEDVYLDENGVLQVIPSDCSDLFTPHDTYSGGDPHFKTWSGDWFDFHYACDLLFLHSPDFQNGLGLDIQLRTTTRFKYSFIESVAMRIGEDVLEVSGFGSYMWNGVSNAATEEMKFAGTYSVLHEDVGDGKKHTFTIPIPGYRTEEESIVIASFKDMLSVKIQQGSAKDFGNSTGIMGRYHDGMLVARDGVTFMNHDYVAFGMEWQVQPQEDGMLFQVAREPQAPHEKCVMPKAFSDARRRLGESISMEAATAACAYLKSEEQKEMCIFDVMATSDLEVAEVAGSY